MLEATPSVRQWSAQLHSFATRLFEQALYYLGEMNAPARLIVLLTVTVFCYVAMEGARPQRAQ